MRVLVEVSHVIRPGMTTYPGLPAPEAETLVDYDASRARYEGKSEFLIAGLHLCGNTGTYVDSPRHRFRAGKDLAELPLERVAHVPIAAIDARGVRAIGPALFEGALVSGRAVIVRTDFSAHFGTPAYFEGNPHLTEDACRLLAERGAAMVGIDSLNIDAVEDLARPAHTVLLGAGIPICEHMTNLAALPAEGFLHAVPIAWAGGTTFPVRAYVVG